MNPRLFLKWFLKKINKQSVVVQDFDISTRDAESGRARSQPSLQIKDSQGYTLKTNEQTNKHKLKTTVVANHRNFFPEKKKKKGVCVEQEGQ